MKYKKMILAALLAALCCVATLAFQLPIAQGYVNLGDCFVLLSGWLLGPVWGAAAGGIGSMLADVFLGYGTYAPATLIIKALMAFLAAGIARKDKSVYYLCGGLAAELLMAFGYFAYEGIVLGLGLPAAANLPWNLLQGAVGLVAAFLILQVFRKNQFLQKYISR